MFNIRNFLQNCLKKITLAEADPMAVKINDTLLRFPSGPSLFRLEVVGRYHDATPP